MSFCHLTEAGLQMGGVLWSACSLVCAHTHPSSPTPSPPHTHSAHVLYTHPTINPPHIQSINAHNQVRPLKPNEDPLNGTQIYVILVSIGTVCLWCFNTFLSTYTGEMGILAIIPLVAFFGFGVLE